MLGYVTIEDVLGVPESPGGRPRGAQSDTLAALFDRGMRGHVRRAVLFDWRDERLEATPDWRFDRLVIRLALYCRERLHVEPGARVAVFGRLDRLWPAADFAALGFGAVSVGLEHGLSDDALRAALADAAPQVAFASDPESAARLLRVRADAALPQTVVVPDGVPADVPGALALAELLEHGATLDTAERAQNFRLCSRSLDPGSPACWHYAAHPDAGRVRFTHAEAVARVLARQQAQPARPGDVAYIAAPRVTLRVRLAWYAFVGDGHTTAALGRAGRVSDDVAELRPTALLVPHEWIETAWAEAVAGSDGLLHKLSRRFTRSRLLRALDERPARQRRRARARLGERLRFIETPVPPERATAAALTAAGIAWTTEVGAAG